MYEVDKSSGIKTYVYHVDPSSGIEGNAFRTARMTNGMQKTGR